MYQDIAWQATVILVIAVLVLFAWVALRASQRSDYEAIRGRATHLRTVVFWGLVILCTPIIVYSLADLPYPRRDSQSGSAEVITATGHQWRWELSKNQVVAGKPVEFHVTTGDVTHGFGIYDPQLRLVAQTQAMPGYTNVLRHTFKQPGDYKILCLEYCGLAHHGMMAELTVVASE
jgi:cytochrome c oxidase subunit 2